MIRTITAGIAALIALAVSLGYYYVLRDGYAQPTEIAGTLYRFAGSTLTVLLVITAVLLTFPRIVATRLRRFATAAGILGWVLIEVGVMAFSLYFDYEHLDQSTSPWDDLQNYAIAAGFVFLLASATLFLIRPSILARNWTAVAWVALFALAGFISVVVLLVVALFLRGFLFVVPAATLITVILLPIVRSSLASRAPVTVDDSPAAPEE